mmetsp:Transcript_2775/g.5778  ORF Transcript_2775/g.5778 Transcript_2775/m.5778 type:complete len:225 (+) Transcript_2775:300-974(+)
MGRDAQHLVHAPHARHDRPGNGLLAENQRNVIVAKALVFVRGDAHAAIGTAELEHVQIRTDVGIVRARVDNDIELPGQTLHLFRIPQASVKLLGSDFEALFSFCLSSRKRHHVSTLGLGEFNGARSQASNGGHGNLHGRLHIVANGFVNGPSSAHERSYHFRRNFFRNKGNKSFIDAHDLSKASTKGIVRVLSPTTGAGAEESALVTLFAPVNYHTYTHGRNAQ